MNNYNNNRQRMQNRQGRFYNNRPSGFRDRDHRDRRDYRDRRSRDRSYERSYSPDPMRKVDEAKEKINKMIEDGDEPPRRSRTRDRSDEPQEKRPDGPLSEGEEREEEDYENWGVGEEGDEKVR